jgi:hypothetical protein
MRLCLIGGVIILLVIIIGILLLKLGLILSSPDCCEENLGYLRSVWVYR